MRSLLACGVLLGVATMSCAEGLTLTADSPIYEATDPALALSAAVTLEAWVRPAALPASGARILDRHRAGSDDGYLLDTWPGNSLRLITAHGALTYPAKLPSDRWTHVVGVYDAAERVCKLYVDGHEVASATTGAFPPLANVDLPLRLGANQNGGDRLVGGVLRAAVYSRALTATEVAARSAGGAPPAGVVGAWEFAAQPGRVIRPVAGTVALQRSGADVELTGQAPPPELPLATWYRQPAQQWVEALPLGNGRLGAMVFGRVAHERLQLNEGTFWSAGPYNPARPGTAADLQQARELIFAGKYREAEAVVTHKLMGQPGRQTPYQPVGDLNLEFAGGDTASDYRRELDLDTATARIQFVRDGVRYTRELFISPVDQVMVVRLTADQPGKLTLTARFATPQARHEFATAGGDTVILRATGPDAQGIAGQVQCEARARLLPTGGTLTADGAAVSVRGADAVTILVGIATNYRRWDQLSSAPARGPLEAVDQAATRRYEDLHQRHVAEHQRLFRRVSLDLGGAVAARTATDERIRAIATGAVDPALAALYFQFGRYLLLSCSRPGGQPATLQGLWNESTSPPWDSKYTININTEMNYWPAETTNLDECLSPLVELVRELAQSGERTAQTMFGARGWVAFHNTDHWRASAPIDGPWAYTPTCGAWLATHLWDRYRFIPDPAYLGRVYPVLKGAALFFLDTLVPEPTHGWLVTCPSASPENRHIKGANVCAGPTMDNQILRDTFDQAIRAAEILQVDPALRAQWAAARAKLPPDQIGKAGQLQEWLEDWDTEPGADLHHRHVSHLYGLFPSGQIGPERTPALAAAARKSLELRGDQATGWSLGWKINLWARLRDGDHAHRMITMLLSPDRTYPNLFDAHPPFQIDGNFGGTAGMAEMLLQSYETTPDGRPLLRLLPALPAAWPTGRVHGLRARGGFEVDLSWQGGHLTEAKVTSRSGQQAQLCYGAARHDVVLANGKTAVWTGG